MKERVALINPPAPFLENPRVFHNVGLLYVANAMKRTHDVKIIDLNGVDNYREVIKGISNDFDVFGFTSNSPQFFYVADMNRIIKQNNPRAITMIGGAHVTSIMATDDTLNNSRLNEFDSIFVGEADKYDFSNRRRIMQGSLVDNLDDVEIPNRKLIDIQSYHYKLRGINATNLMTQRGCPFKCTFCSGREVDMYRKARAHSPERVVQELDYLNKEFGYTAFMCYDDELNLDKNRLKGLAKLLKGKGYTFRGFFRSDLLVRNPESLDYLKDIGFVELCSGVESGSDRILKRINKGTTSEINSKACAMVNAAGIDYKAFVMIGHQGETLEDVALTEKWLRDNKLREFNLSIVHPYPGCIIYNKAKPSTKFPDFKWEYDGLYFNKPDYSQEPTFYNGRNGEYNCQVRTDELSSNDIIRLRDKIENDVKRSLNDRA